MLHIFTKTLNLYKKLYKSLPLSICHSSRNQAHEIQKNAKNHLIGLSFLSSFWLKLKVYIVVDGFVI